MLKTALFIKTPEHLQNLLKKELILVNGKIVKMDTDLVNGDKITLYTPQSLEPFVNTNFSIAYEDEYLFVVNKPPQLPVHPAGKYYFNTLTNLIRKRCPKLGETIYLCNRLDRETSGLIIFAKSKEIAAQIKQLFTEKKISKIYTAIVIGKCNFTEKIIDLPLLNAKVGEIRNHIIVHPNGKKSITNITQTTIKGNFTILSIKTETGRRHQIRAHLSHIGFPIVGDKQYGCNPNLLIEYTTNPNQNKNKLINQIHATRHYLHCNELKFTHPQKNKIISVKIELPHDMISFIKRMTK